LKILTSVFINGAMFYITLAPTKQTSVTFSLVANTTH